MVGVNVGPAIDNGHETGGQCNVRLQLNLDTVAVTGRKVLIHGTPNAGKTYLAGSFLKGGDKVLFINTKGEDGTRSLASLGLGQVGETVETIQDLKDLIKDYVKADLDRVVLDSLKFVWSFAIEKIAGKGNLPKTGGNSNHWSEIHALALGVTRDLLDLASDVLIICPSDVSMDQVKGDTKVTPDLPGRQAAGIAGSFDTVGYLESNTIGSNVKRIVHFEPMSGVVTRLRGTSQLKRPITLSEGPGCWGEIEKALEEVGA